MGIAIQKIFAQLLFWLYDFLDAIFETFQVLAGIQPVDYDGGEISLINIFLTHNTVTQVFLSIFLISIILVAICIIIRVNEFWNDFVTLAAARRLTQMDLLNKLIENAVQENREEIEKYQAFFKNK